jgi:hypothetical protein
MGQLSNVILAVAGAALIAIGIGAQTGAFSHLSTSSFHRSTSGSVVSSAPHQNDTTTPPPVEAPKQPQIASPSSPDTSVTGSVVIKHGDDDEGEGNDD